MSLWKFLVRFKRSLLLFSGVVFCTALFMVSFATMSPISVPNNLQATKQQIVLRCEVQTKPCLNAENLLLKNPAGLTEFFKYISSKNTYQIEAFINKKGQIQGFLVTPSQVWTKVQWTQFQLFFAKVNKENPLFLQSVTPVLEESAQAIWNKLSFSTLFTILLIVCFLIFFAFQMRLFGSAWGSLNSFFNLSLSLFVVVCIQQFNFVLTVFNLTLFLVGWIGFSFWQTQMMQAATRLRVQKTFWQFYSQNGLFGQQIWQFFTFFALLIFVYFLVNFPPYQQKLFLTSFQISLPENTLFSIAKFLLLIFLGFGIGLVGIYQFILLGSCHFFRHDYFPRTTTKENRSAFLLETSKSLKAPISWWRAWTAKFGFALAVCGLIVIPLVYSLQKQFQLVSETQVSFAAEPVRAWRFFARWKIFLLTLGLLFVVCACYYLLIFGWQTTFLWIGQLIITATFLCLLPFALALLFPDLRFNGTLLFAFFLVLLAAFAQDFLFLHQFHFGTQALFIPVSWAQKSVFCFLLLFPLIIWSGIDWKRTLFFTLFTLLFPLWQKLKQIFFGWGYSGFARLNAHNTINYARFKTAAGQEKEIKSINE